MYQNLSATSEAEIAFRQAIDNVDDAEQREQLRQAYIQVETQVRTRKLYSFAQDGIKYFLPTAIKLGHAALVKFFLTKYDWERWFNYLPNIAYDIIANSNLELLNWLLKESLNRVKDRCCLDLFLGGMVQTAIEFAQLTVIRYFCETYEQEWQQEYTKSGGSWLTMAAQMGQVEIVQFLLTRDNAEQMMSNMVLAIFVDPRTKIESKLKVFVDTIETIIRACVEIRSEKLFTLFIGRVQRYIALQPQEEQPGLQALVKRAIAIERSKLQQQRADKVNTFAGLVNAVSETTEAKIAAYNSAKK